MPTPSHSRQPVSTPTTAAATAAPASHQPTTVTDCRIRLRPTAGRAASSTGTSLSPTGGAVPGVALIGFVARLVRICLVRSVGRVVAEFGSLVAARRRHVPDDLLQHRVGG